MFLALKEIKREKSRFILIVSIILLISYLVFFLSGLAYGLGSSNRSSVDKWKAHRIVLQEGTNKNILSSVLEKSAIEDFKDNDISPINVSSAIAYKNGEKSEDSTFSIFMMGLEKNSKAIAPLVLGKPIKDYETEVIASISMKEEEGFELNDKIKLSQNDREFKIVGFTEDSKFSVRPVVYTSLENASKEFMSYKKEENIDQKSQATNNPPERISAIIIHDDKDLNENLKYDILPVDEYIENLPGYLAQVLTFVLMIGFLIIIASIVLGVFMYIITMQKKQTFAILKIQGISSSYISKSVIIQTLIVTFLGVSLGLALTYLSEVFLPASVPFRSNFIYYIFISLMIFVFTFLGAVFSVRGVSKVEALEVLE